MYFCISIHGICLCVLKDLFPPLLVYFIRLYVSSFVYLIMYFVFYIPCFPRLFLYITEQARKLY